MPTKCDPDDPARCQASGGQGQCEYKALPGCRHCEKHNGKAELQVAEHQSFRLNKEVAERVHALSTPAFVKSLDIEIGTINQLYEELYNSCKSPQDRSAAQSRLMGLAKLSAELKRDNLKMKKEYDELLARQTVLHLAQCVADVCTEVLKDVPNFEELIDQIIEGMSKVIQEELSKK